MTVEEIFSQISEHMVEGLMTHSQLSDYFGFLGLEGYQECHKYHYFSENINYRKLSDYYLSYYDKIIIEMPFTNPNIIPKDWYQYIRQEVDASTRKKSIQAGFEKWITWETQTKEKYQYFYNELIKLNEIATAEEIKHYIMDVNKELTEAKHKYLMLVANNFNISDIIIEQKELKEFYKDKLKNLP